MSTPQEVSYYDTLGPKGEPLISLQNEDDLAPTQTEGYKVSSWGFLASA